MEITELRERIRTSVTEQHTLELNYSLVPQAGDLVRYVGLEKLIVEEIALQETEEAINVTGKARLLDVVCEVNLRAWVKDEVVKLRLSASPSPTWDFSQSFPNLPSWWRESSGGVYEPQESFLAHLTIENPSFVISSHQEGTIAKGLNVTGKLSPTGVLSKLHNRLGLPNSMPLYGTIQLQAGAAPLIDLRADLASVSFDLGIVALEQPKLRLRTVAAPEVSEAESRLELTGIITVGAREPTRYLVSAPLLENDRLWAFEAHTEELSKTLMLEELTTLMGGSSADFELPDALQGLSDFYLTDILVGIYPSNRTVAYIGCALATPATWDTPIPDLKISDISLSWLIDFPFDPKWRFLSCTLTGIFEIGKANPVGIEVNVGLPHLKLEGHLEEGDVISIADVVSQFIEEVSDLPQTDISYLRLVADLRNRDFTIEAKVDSDWCIPVGVGEDLIVDKVELLLEFSQGGLEGTINGKIAIGDVDAFLVGKIGRQVCLEARFPKLSLSAIAERFLGAVSITTDLPDFEFKDVELSVTPETGEFSIRGCSAQPWTIDVGEGGLQFSNIIIDVARQDVDGGQMALSGVIGGTLTVGGVEFQTEYRFPGDFELTADVPAFNIYKLMEGLCGTTVVGDVPVPVKLKELDVTGVQVTIAPKQKLFRLAGQTDMGRAELMVKRINGKWGFSVGIAATAAWQFSQIADELDVLNQLTLSNVALVFSSSDDPAFALSTVSVPQATTSIVRGLNFFADINLTGLGVSDITGVGSLSVYAAISDEPSKIVLQAALEGDCKLAENVYFGNVAFQLRAAPAFSIALVGTVRAILDSSPLVFTGGMRVGPRQAVLKVTMDGTWKEPFGTEGLEVSDVALDLGVSYPPFVPVIGIAGSLKIRDFEGSAAIKFDSANPARSMIAVAFNQLHLDDVVGALCADEIKAAIPDELQNTLREIRFEDVDLYIAPQPTQIGDRQFEQGLSLEGSLYLSDLRAYARTVIDRAEGVLVQGELDAIKVGEVFKLTGAEDAANPSLFIELKRSEVPSVNITGEVELLGMSRATDIHISDDGFRFFTEGNLFGQFACTLEAEGSLTRDSAEFWVVGTLQNDLRQYLRDRASDVIKEAASEATAEITEAQQKIAAAQADLDQLDNQIQVRRTEIERRRAAARAKLDQARRNLSVAQSKVDSLVRTIQSKEQLCGQLSRKKICRSIRVWVPTPTWRNPFAGHYEYRTICTPDANALKQAAALRIEISKLYVELGVRKTALAAARTAVQVASRAIETTPIELDPILVGLYAACETAEGVLAAAHRFLQRLKETVGRVAAIGDFLLNCGSGALIEVRSARFETALSAAAGGLISLDLELVFMGKSKTVALEFNFKDPLRSARELGQRLLQG